MSDLLNEVEQAMALMTAAAIGAEANVYAGKSSGEKKLPCVICEALGEAEEDPKYSGNYWVMARWRIKATAATEANGVDPSLADIQLVSDVSALIRVNNLDTALNAQGRVLTVFPNGFIIGSPERQQDELGAWEDILPVRLYCCNSVIAP